MPKAKDLRPGDQVTFKAANEIRTGVVVGDVTSFDGAYVVFDVEMKDVGRRTFRIHRESTIEVKA